MPPAPPWPPAPPCELLLLVLLGELLKLGLIVGLKVGLNVLVGALVLVPVTLPLVAAPPVPVPVARAELSSVLVLAPPLAVLSAVLLPPVCVTVRLGSVPEPEPEPPVWAWVWSMVGLKLMTGLEVEEPPVALVLPTLPPKP